MKTDIFSTVIFAVFTTTLHLLIFINSNNNAIVSGQEYYPSMPEYVPPLNLPTDPKIVSRDVKCAVCKATLDEMILTIKKVDPKKIVEVSGFRMDPSGNSVSKRVQLSKSETYLTELMESICSKMDDYAKARYKTTRELIVLKLITESGGMNPIMSEVDFVTDEDLNKSLKHFCLEILEDHEEPILTHFMADELDANVRFNVCTKTAKYCDETQDVVPDDEESAEQNYEKVEL